MWRLKCLPWPRIDPGHFEPVVPGPGIGTLSLGPGADPVSMCFPLLPATAVGAAVVEVEPSPIHLGLVDGRRARSSRRGQRAPNIPPATVHLVRLLHTLVKCVCTISEIYKYTTRAKADPRRARFRKVPSPAGVGRALVVAMKRCCDLVHSLRLRLFDINWISARHFDRSCGLSARHCRSSRLPCPGRTVWTPASRRTRRLGAIVWWNRPSSTRRDGRPCSVSFCFFKIVMVMTAHENFANGLEDKQGDSFSKYYGGFTYFGTIHTYI